MADNTKVMVDLSFAMLGYGGISQDARLMFKILSQTEGLEPTGLIYDLGDAVMRHRFARESAPFDQRLENQAKFMLCMADRQNLFSEWRLVRLFQRIGWYRRLLLDRRVTLQNLETEFFWDSLWRNAMEKTLEHGDRELIFKHRFVLANAGANMMHARSMLPQLPRVQLDTRGQDFAIFQDSRSVRVSPSTQKIIRYHDIIPLIRPDLVGVDLQSSRRGLTLHMRNIQRCVEDGSIYVCNSEPTRQDLIRIFPKLENRSFTIPYALSTGYRVAKNASLIPQIIRSRKSNVASNFAANSKGSYADKWQDNKGKPLPYIMMVSTIEGRKNYVGLIRAFEQLRSRQETELRLIIVGSPGWRDQDTLKAMAPLVAQGLLAHLEAVPTQELRTLYNHAEAFVFPSYYEGFGFPPMEAMLCGTPVIVSDQPAHRWVMGDAALYCDAYNVDNITDTMERLLFTEPRLRETLVERGKKQVQRYSMDAVGQQWSDLFEQLKGRKKNL